MWVQLQRRRRHVAVCLSVLLPLSMTGCQRLNARLDADERAELRRRATGLLIRAAQGDVDVVCCNALEAFVDVAPQEGLPYFRAALDSESPLVRFAGCAALGEVGDKASLKQVQRCLSDEDPRVRLGAAFAAYRMGDTGQARILVDALNNSEDANLRADAALLIGRLSESGAVKRLRLRINDNKEKSQKVKIHINAALARLGDKTGLEELMRYAQYDALSRLIALQCLCDVADPQSRDALLYRLEAEDEYLEAKLIAARALGKIGSGAGFELALKNTRYSGDDAQGTMRVRSLAALALGAIGDQRGLPQLRELAETESDPRTQVAACYAIRQILRGEPER